MSEFENSDRQLTVYFKEKISNIFEIKAYVVHCWNSRNPLIRTRWFKNRLAEIFHFNTKNIRTCLAKHNQASSYMWVLARSLTSRLPIDIARRYCTKPLLKIIS